MPSSTFEMTSRLIEFVPRYHRGVGNWSGHQPFAYALVEEMRPTRFVELGTHYGESYFTFCQSVLDHDVPCACFAVDTWQGDPQAGFYGDEVYEVVDAHNREHYEKFSKLLRMTFDEAVAQFENESIDLLHIDGLHTYEAVRHDFETWFSRVRPGGVVLFHDTAVRDGDFGVWKLWEELCSQHATFAFTHSNGLGVLRKAGGPELEGGVLSALLSTPGGDLAVSAADYFQLLGQNLRLRQVEGDAPGSLVSLGRARGKVKKLERRLRRMRRIAFALGLVAFGLLVLGLLGQ